MGKGNYSPVTNQLSSHQQLSFHLQLKKPINYSLAADERDERTVSNKLTCT